MGSHAAFPQSSLVTGKHAVHDECRDTRFSFCSRWEWDWNQILGVWGLLLSGCWQIPSPKWRCCSPSLLIPTSPPSSTTAGGEQKNSGTTSPTLPYLDPRRVTLVSIPYHSGTSPVPEPRNARTDPTCRTLQRVPERFYSSRRPVSPSTNTSPISSRLSRRRWW